MRLIDADKLKSELFDADWMMDNDEGHVIPKACRSLRRVKDDYAECD